VSVLDLLVLPSDEHNCVRGIRCVHDEIARLVKSITSARGGNRSFNEPFTIFNRPVDFGNVQTGESCQQTVSCEANILITKVKGW
jgi:hypothetical protein